MSASFGLCLFDSWPVLLLFMRRNIYTHDHSVVYFPLKQYLHHFILSEIQCRMFIICLWWFIFSLLNIIPWQLIWPNKQIVMPQALRLRTNWKRLRCLCCYCYHCHHSSSWFLLSSSSVLLSISLVSLTTIIIIVIIIIYNHYHYYCDHYCYWHY